MAASIDKQIVRELLKRLKHKETTNKDALRLSEWIAFFQGKKVPAAVEPPAAPPLDPSVEPAPVPEMVSSLD